MHAWVRRVVRVGSLAVLAVGGAVLVREPGTRGEKEDVFRTDWSRASAAWDAAVPAAGAREPMLIAPMIEAPHTCAQPPVERRPDPNLRAWCSENELTAGELLARELDALEPGGPKGAVRIGWTFGVDLFNLYRRDGDEWRLASSRIDAVVDRIAAVDRPVVVYLMANHFASRSPLAKRLGANKTNLMRLPDGTPPTSRYFETPVQPFTLSTDASVPVNRYRFRAVRRIVEALMSAGPPVKERIAAVTLNGETHQMFPNLADATGKFDDVGLTDYAPRSRRAFVAWLRERFETIAELNATVGSAFDRFRDVSPPRSDLINGSDGPVWRHLDSYAHGRLPVFGWVHDPDGVIERLVVSVDGDPVGTAERGLNRLDVVQALPGVQDPNVGFRYALAVRDLSPGGNEVVVTAVTQAGQRYRVAKRRVALVRPMAGAAIDRSGGAGTGDRAEDGWPRGTKGHLDHPREGQRVLYNPLAELWYAFRQHQVAAYLEKMARIARTAGAPPTKIYSHQIVPSLNGSWNRVLFATAQSLDADRNYRLGVTLYGGAAAGPALDRVLESADAGSYGVPEFHTQAAKVPGAALAALLWHYQRGARFVSPYFLSLTPEAFRGTTDHDRFRLKPGNEDYGSDHLYRAIRRAASF